MDLLQSFLRESQTQLDELERGLVRLEDANASDDTVHALFRAAHTLKGNAGMVNQHEFVRFMHVLENILSRIRDGMLVANTQLVDTLLRAADVSRGMLESISNGGSAAATDGYAPTLQALQDILGDLAVGGAPEQLEVEARELVVDLSFDCPPDLVVHKARTLFTDLKLIGEVRAVEPPPTAGTLDYRVVVFTGARHADIESMATFEDARVRRIHTRVEGSSTESGSTNLGTEGDAASSKPGGPRKGATPRIGAEVRVDAERFDELVDLTCEMVVASARVELLLRDAKADAISRADAVAALAKMVRSVQERAIALRMVTVGDMFQRFARPVRDLARELGRQVIFETHGVETQLDRKLIDQLVDPLKHLIRNAIVHGVEDPQDRIAAGKPPEGRLRLCASQQNGSAVLEVTDDGAGINRPRVIEKALELGLLAPGADPTERQIHELLFLPGFSTAKRVSEIAGRGVGLDVLRKAVETLRGKIEIISAMGKGTTFRVLLPVTLAIVDGLQVRVGTAPLIIPLAAVVELVDGFTARLVTNHGGDQSLRLRDDLLPLVHVPKVLKNIKAQSQRCSTIVVVETEHRRFGIAVDEVLGVARAVIKPLEEALMLPSTDQTEVSASAAVSGATVLPDGNVGLIMDVHGLETLVFA